MDLTNNIKTAMNTSKLKLNFKTTHEERVKVLHDVLDGVVPESVVDWLIKHGFVGAPASAKYHGSYCGGLCDHSFAVTKHLLDLTEKHNLKWSRPESPFIVGMFHDLCKIDQYTNQGDKYKFQYNTPLKGHGEKSVMLMAMLMPLTEEECLCIRYHMGAFVEKEEWADFTNAIHRYPNVLWTHQADMLAAHVDYV